MNTKLRSGAQRRKDPSESDKRFVNFPFYIPCSMMQLLQCNPKHNNLLIYAKCYIFRASLAHHQEVYSCVKQSLKLSVFASM